MSVSAILLPLLVQVGIAFAVLFRLGPLRLGAIRRGEVNSELASIDERAWPANIRQVSNSFRNQFELPVLFYVLVVLALVTHKADLLFVVLSWLFVVTRAAHAFVHVTSNDVRWRFPLFAAGVGILATMWLLFAFAILFAPVLP